MPILRTGEFLEQAMRDCGDAVYRLAYCRLGNRADAEDVYQDVFLRLLQDTTAFRDNEHRKAWLLRTTLNRCNDFHRSIWRHTAPLDAVSHASAPETEDYSELWDAVATLPADLRTVVYLYYVEDCGTNEIAAIMGCRPVTVRTRLHRARKQLKHILEGNGYEESERTKTSAERESAGRA